MIFADKLIQLRKKNGWSQEELAEQMKVSRQAVSKWEGAQSIPDLEKIIRLSALFGVTTDYLLKDDMEESISSGATEDVAPLRRVSMEEANAFLSVKEATSKSIASATFLCILSPICLIILGAASESPAYRLSDNMAAGIGMIILLAFIAVAVAIFISSGSKTSSFTYLEKEVFETEYGVSGMVKDRKQQYRSTYTRNNIAGTCICILSLTPLFAGIILNDEDDLFTIIMFTLTMVIAGIGVTLFIRSGIIWASFDKLLQEGDYSKQKKEQQSIATAISTAYWTIATTIYLAYSFTSNSWDYSWIIWVVAGVLYPAILAVLNIFEQKK